MLKSKTSKFCQFVFTTDHIIKKSLPDFVITAVCILCFALLFFSWNQTMFLCVHIGISFVLLSLMQVEPCVCFSNCSETEVRLMFHERRAAWDQGPWGRDGAAVVLARSLAWLAGFPAVWHTLRSHAALTHAVYVLKLLFVPRRIPPHAFPPPPLWFRLD